MKRKLLTALTVISSVFAFGQQSNAKFTTQNNSEFTKTISKKETQLIDVRTSGEYASGHIPGAINIDVQSETFENKIAKLDKSKPVAVYCRSGARSKIAARKLTSLGYTVFELKQGISNWNGKIDK